MSKRQAESDCKCEFNEEWENDFLFIANPAGKPLCIVCETTLSYNKKHDLDRHYKTQHQTTIEDEKKLRLGSELHKKYVTKKKEEIRRRQKIFGQIISEDLAMTEGSYEIALHLAKRKKPFSDEEEIVKPCLQIFAKHLGNKSIEKKADEIAISKQTVTRRKKELSQDVSWQLEGLVSLVLSSH